MTKTKHFLGAFSLFLMVLQIFPQVLQKVGLRSLPTVTVFVMKSAGFALHMSVHD